MTKTTSELYQFQFNYLLQLIENIPNERLYEKQLEGINSAGWVLGHLTVEVEDVFEYFNIEYPLDDHWRSLFRNTTGKIESLDNLPSKEELIEVLKFRYKLLHEFYLSLSEEQLNGPHPSTFLASKLSTLNAYMTHNLATHIAIHCGNLTTWKKVVGIDVNGY